MLTQTVQSILPALLIVGRTIIVSPTDESFIVTSMGGIRYLVSVVNGAAYSRSQFIEKYQHTNATYVIVDHN